MKALLWVARLRQRLFNNAQYVFFPLSLALYFLLSGRNCFHVRKLCSIVKQTHAQQLRGYDSYIYLVVFYWFWRTRGSARVVLKSECKGGGTTHSDGQRLVLKI